MRAGRHKRPLVSFLSFVFDRRNRCVGATLQGTIVDPKGADIPDGTVRVLGAQGKEVGHTVTDEQEVYFMALAPESYTIKVSLLVSAQ